MTKLFWRTEIVIWSKWDPTDIPPSELVKEAERGSAYMSRAHSEEAEPTIEDGPPEGWGDHVDQSGN